MKNAFSCIIAIAFTLAHFTSPAQISVVKNNLSFIDNLTALNNQLLFTCDDGTHGTALWKSDGTSSGTVMVDDMNKGDDFAFSMRYFTVVNNTLYFSAYDTTYSQELWKSDGTTGGTVAIPVNKKVHSNSSPYDLVNYNGTLYFTAADDTMSGELWKTDGTVNGTVMLKDINQVIVNYPINYGSTPHSKTVSNNNLFFGANDGIHGDELWKTDGTTAGTVMVKDIYPGATGSSLIGFVNFNNTLFFIANDGIHGSELWKSDGTDAGTVMVKDIHPGITSGSVTNLVVVNGILFFSANDGSIPQSVLWKSDGTETGTQVVSSSVFYPSQMLDVNGELFFSAGSYFDGSELFKSDGTDAGTRMVKDVFPGSTGSYPIYAYSIGGIHFSDPRGSNATGFELWQSDGTDAGTFMVQDLNPGSASAYPYLLTRVGNTLFFSASSDDPTAHLFEMPFPTANYTITASAEANGTITPSGVITLPAGTPQTFAITANDNCHYIQDVQVDGISQGALSTYTFNSIDINHTILASFAATVVSHIVPAGTFNICAASQITLNADGEPGLTYQWYRNGNPLPGATNQFYNTSITGKYTVLEGDASGCTAMSAITTLKNYPVSTPTITVLNNGNLNLCNGAVKLKATIGNQYTVQWQRNGNAINGATSIGYQPAMAGNYRVVVTTPQSCTASSAPVSVVKPCKLGDYDEATYFTAYPNPSNGNFRIEYNDGVNYNKCSVSIMNLLGQSVYSQAVKMEDGTFSLDLNLNAANPSGIYYVKVWLDDKIITRKIVVQH